MPSTPIDPVPPTSEQFSVRIFFEEYEAAQEFLLANRLDYGCRPMISHEADEFAIPAFCTVEQIAEFEAAGVRLAVVESLTARKLERLNEVGRGDRFEGGLITPRGLGIKVAGEDLPSQS